MEGYQADVLYPVLQSIPDLLNSPWKLDFSFIVLNSRNAFDLYTITIVTGIIKALYRFIFVQHQGDYQNNKYNSKKHQSMKLGWSVLMH